MKRVAALLVSGAVLAMAGSATSAFALNQPSKSAKVNDTGSAPVSLTGISVESGTAGTKQQSKVYQWSVKGRWGVKLDVNQDEARPSGWNDVDAGAFYKITPSVRVGGSVGFGEKTKSLQPTGPSPEKDQPRVRLETTFKF